jgi:tetratricopeptide (TPR) repeat protein
MEGRSWLQAVLALSSPVPAHLRARALAIAGGLAVDQGNPGAAIPLLEEALALVRAHGEQAVIAMVRGELAHARLYASDYRQAVPLLEECLAWARGAGDAGFVAWFLEDLGRAALEQGDNERAKPLLEESLALNRARGATYSVAWDLSHLSQVALYEGKYAQVLPLAEESLALFRELGAKQGIAWIGRTLAWVVLQRGEVEGAVPPFKQSLATFRELGDKRNIAYLLDALAAASAKGCYAPAMAGRRATRLFAAAAALRDVQGTRLPPADEALYRPYVAAVRGELDEAAFAAAWAEGQAMSLEQAVAYALDEAPATSLAGGS